MAVGVKPWSAKATSTASNMLRCCGVGRRLAMSQKASSPKVTFPNRSSARLWPSTVMLSVSEVPRPVR